MTVIEHAKSLGEALAKSDVVLKLQEAKVPYYVKMLTLPHSLLLSNNV